MLPIVIATMVTTTSYGTWLPGDLRGYVDRGQVLPGNPSLLNHAKSVMKGAPVLFKREQQLALMDAIQSAAKEFRYALTDISIEQWHLHWIVGHGFDPVEVMIGRLKNRMRQALNIGRIWTEGYCHRCLTKDVELLTAREYIARHDGCRMSGGQIIGQ
jgi:hypothetical protein